MRRDSGETYQAFLTRLARRVGHRDADTGAIWCDSIATRPQKGRNTDWKHSHDPDARITKMKDGRTHLAHKAEHAVDLETGALVGVTVQEATQGGHDDDRGDAHDRSRGHRGRGPRDR